MSEKSQKNLAIISFFVILTFVLYFWFIKTPYFQNLKAWSEQNLLLTFLFIISVKILGIVWPPLPGGLLTLGAIPILGWKGAYLADFTGSMVGTSIAFFLGKKYGKRIVSKLFDEEAVQKLTKIKVKQDKEVEAVFALRLVGGNTVLEAVCYGAGMLGVKYRNFIIGSVASHSLLGIPTFYLAQNIFQTKNIILNAIMILFLFLIIWKARGRYFE